MLRAFADGAFAQVGANHTLGASYSTHIRFLLGPQVSINPGLARRLRGFVLRGLFRSELVRKPRNFFGSAESS